MVIVQAQVAKTAKNKMVGRRCGELEKDWRGLIEPSVQMKRDHRDKAASHGGVSSHPVTPPPPIPHGHCIVALTLQAGGLRLRKVRWLCLDPLLHS